MSPRPMRRYVAPRLVCFVCGKAITGETRMVGWELAHPGCAARWRAGKGRQGMNALGSLLGRRGDAPKCRVVSDKIAVHWFAIDARPGDPCLCGTITKDADEDVAVEAPRGSA